MPGLPNRSLCEPARGELPRPVAATVADVSVPIRLPAMAPSGEGTAVAAAGGGPGNSARLATVVERIRASVHGSEPGDLFSLCVSLARGVDYAVTHNEIPEVAKDLPAVVKQVYQWKNNAFLLSAIMMLMNSMKTACERGWFHDVDIGEFNVLLNEVSSSFSCKVSSTVEPTMAFSIVSKIMPRFYPQLNLGDIIVSIEAKPGYEILLADFHISKSSPPTFNERIRLLVAQKDYVETSSCIISPPEVNFMINGRGVEKRIPGFVDTGPQLPSDVTSMLIFGTNLMQAVGQFNGNYIIVLAYMSSRSSYNLQASKLQLKEYSQPKAMAESTSDGEIIEGKSKVSLNCPISLKRIKTPVKGRLCRHHQCYDFDNYIEINIRRPSWRCPHCNQSVSFCDVRIDRNMVEVLSKVGEDAEDVFILADGSWEVSSGECGDHESQLKKSSATDQRGLEADLQSQNGEAFHSNASVGIVDLTMEESDDCAVDCSVRNNNCMTDERKPFCDSLCGVDNITVHPVVSTSDTVAQGATHVETYNDIWSRLPFSVAASNSGSNSGAIMLTATSADGRIREPFSFPQVSVSAFGASPAPVITDAVSPALSRGISPTSTTPAIHSAEMREIVNTANNLQLQQGNRFGNSIGDSSESVPGSSVSRHVTRTPNAVQTLPAQRPIPISSGLHQRLSQPTSHPMNSASGIDIEIPQTFSRSVGNPVLASDIASIVGALPAMNQSISKMRTIPADMQRQRAGSFGHPGSTATTDHYQSQSRLQNQAVASNLLQQSSRLSAGPFYNNSMGSQQHHGQRMGSLASQFHTSSQLGTEASGVRIPKRTSLISGSVNGIRQSAAIAGEQHHLRHFSSPAHVATEAQSANSFSSELPSEQNWRPTGLMRGSIVGRAHSTALGQLMLQPSSASAITQERPQAPVQSQQPIAFVGGINGYPRTINQSSISESARDPSLGPYHK